MRINDNGVDRDMTQTEQAEYEAWAETTKQQILADNKAAAEKAAAKDSARAKLKALGLTDDEIAALAG